MIHALSDPVLRPRMAIIKGNFHESLRFSKADVPFRDLEHDSQIKRFANAPSPSTASTNPKLCYTGSIRICAGRPASQHGPSNALLDPHLARLAHDLRNLEQIEVASSMIDVALRLLNACAEFYNNEKTREQAIRLMLEEIFPDRNWQDRSVASGGAKPEAYWLLSLIFELKNERGNNGDPETQAIIDYVKILSDVELLRVHFCLLIAH
jgi:hypothetical protein